MFTLLVVVMLPKEIVILIVVGRLVQVGVVYWYLAYDQLGLYTDM